MIKRLQEWVWCNLELFVCGQVLFIGIVACAAILNLHWSN